MASIVKAGLKVLLVLVVASLPSLLLAALGWPGAPVVGAFGAIGALSAAIIGGFRIGVLAAVIIAIGAVIGIAVRDHSVAVAALMIALGGVYGRIAATGVGSAAAMIPALVPYFIEDPPGLFTSGVPDINAQYYIGTAAVVVGSGIWGSWLASRISKGKTRLSPPTPVNLTVGYGLALGAAAGLSAAIAIDHVPQAHWAWLTLTIFVLADPSGRLNVRKVVERLFGTFLGFGFALLLLQLPSNAMWAAFVALALLTLALTARQEGRPYWFYVALLTPVIVLLSSASGTGEQMAGERLWFTALGAAIVVALTVILNQLYSGVVKTRMRHSAGTTNANATVD